MAKILVVEDDLTTRSSITDILESMNCRVESTDNGEDALELCNVSRFDVVVIDWNLPGMSGIDLCKALSKMRSDCRILMLTGKQTLDDKEQGLDSGADDYVTKPFELREFQARIRALLRRSQKDAENIITLGEVRIDTLQRMVQKDGQPIVLKTKEFDLLEFLARNRGTVYSLDSLIRYVWSSDENVSYDAVRQCVKRIRQKIGGNEESIISTVFGVGYKID